MYISDATVQTIVSAIEESDIQKNETAFIMLSEYQIPDIPVLISDLNERKIEFVGGIFPGLIYGSEKHETGAIIKIMPVIGRPVLIQKIGESLKDIEELMRPFRSVSDKNATAFIMVNGFSPNTSPLLASLFSLFADSVEYLGCGTGFVENEQGPVIFTPEGFFEDAAVITFLDMYCNLGVRHGWEKAMGPLVVTKSHGNMIKELNWRNAFEVYSEAVESDRGTTIQESDFLDISAHYPFGIYLEDDENILRVVLQVTDEGCLICAGDMPENTVLNIMKGETPNFIRAANQVMNDCLPEGDLNFGHCFVIDCVGRSIYLQEGFVEELKSIKNGLESHNVHIVPEGVLSVGEIASMGKDLLEFFNYTIVLGLFHEPLCAEDESY